MTLQGALSVISLDETVVSHTTAHYCMLGVSILGVVVAQVKRNTPPGPAPTKGN
jgi:hypothetical protein